MEQESEWAPTIDEDRRRRFEAAWRAGEPARIEDYLPPVDHPYFLPTLEELILIQLENAWKSFQKRSTTGENTLIRPSSLDSYLKKFTVLNRPDIIERLARQEYSVRLRYGDHPTLREYRERYPQATFKELESGTNHAPASDEPPDIPGLEILEVLGRGGMGVVYKARQLALNRLVALKMILAGHAGAEELARFRIEAEALARLQHPNIVQIYEIGEYQRRPYFLLEYAAGGSLAQAANGTPQDPAFAATLTATLARAIHAAHLQGVIHRDLKPANVLLQKDEGGRMKDEQIRSDSSFLLPPPSFLPKITDFGLAKRLDEDRGQTQTGQVMGTPSYMAPEQATARGSEIGPATDVYALGALLYDLLTGRPPFKGATVLDTLDQVRSEEPVPPTRLQPKVPRDLETICLKCLEKEPRRRYASALELAEDLRRQQAGEPITARAVGRVERVQKWARRRPAAAAALGLLALLIVSVAGLNVWHSLNLASQLEQKTAEVNRLNRDRRLESLRDRLKNFQGQWQIAMGNEDWRAAGETLARMKSTLSEETDLPADLVGKGETVAQLAKLLEGARSRFGKFIALRDEVLFHDTLLSGFKNEVDAAQTRRTAEAALALYGDNVDRTYLSEAEETEVRQGVYQTILVLAEAAAREGDTGVKTALALLDRAAKVLPPSRALYLRRARYLDRVDASAANVERKRADAPISSAFDFFLVGEDFFRQGNTTQAIRHFEAALQAQPEHYWSHYFLAVSHVKHARPRLDLARTHLTACLAQRRDIPWVYLLRGFTHSELGDFDLAANDYAEALRQNPSKEARHGIHVNRGVLRIREAAAVEPLTNLWLVGALVGEHAPGSIVAAVAQQTRQRHFAEAQAELDIAISLAPDQFQAYVNKAQVYHTQGNLKAAIGEIDRALKTAPNLPALWRERAKIHAEHEDWLAARADFTQALTRERKLGAKSQQVAIDHVEIARASFKLAPFKLAKFSDVLEHCDAALEIRPDYAAAQRWRAEALLKLGRYYDAVLALDRYEVTGRPVAEIYVARGLAHEKLGEQTAALADFTRALTFGPNAGVFAHRGWVHLLAFDAPRLALSDFEEAIRLGAPGGEAFCGRGLVRVQFGDHGPAIEDAEEALRRGPLSTRLLYNSARIFSQAAGKLDTAGISGPRTQETKQRYQRRAVQLIRDALDRLPPAGRQAFWTNFIQRDAALGPIVRTSEFSQLAAGYARP